MEVDKIKESIKKAAQDLFRKYGYHKTSVNEIAKRAKIAKATIYKYFESKELLLQAILMEYIQQSVHEIIHNSSEELDEEAYLSMIILKTSRLSYTVCNEFIGWEFIRESANSQEFLKTLSDDLENLLIQSFNQTQLFKADDYIERLRFLIKASKSIVFSFAFTSVSDSDVRKNFISFQKEILPYLVKAAVK
ncbi:MAG: TetR family transcriptional regulator [Sphingobacteriales bacterium 17-39-43]|jgi:AcrR family transcriptional regulator|uniref:TetR/AcrR family transcriptional regulator n=1 Tax=Daejeonella sp. TaxID=2805397 RepID=UPI000BD6AA5A|nr:TetR/AcrR family transcriptional regulator [Daejeonella sp.]MCF8451766.1 TetR/AcrR family transcriptional regulator [Pedobacter sp.]OYY02144.1 MAG: TetR family transcriptional regulator [Sphingobacteriia bacterium 35-40-5]OYZ31507.1 MAG: TetR family transcriptional regulator [Sphingobacteriales bacterium 16-39-50]OZA24687.1 MAG: TetR family transcriptional regulator [Sphingobacteriales bacterium 17-39-43]MDP2415717.1 TetR/AcrR family transcriptional regulator [Daejeonella sp.]